MLYRPDCHYLSHADSQPVSACLNAGTIVGISITIFLVSFSTGALLAALITYCCCVRRRRKSSGQSHPSPLESPHPAPLYDEVVVGKLEVKENVAYGPVETLEMKRNLSYGPVRHYSCSLKHCIDSVDHAHGYKNSLSFLVYFALCSHIVIVVYS